MNNKMIHIESITQNIIGMVIAFIILKCFGISTHQSIAIQSVFVVTSYIRSYLIRMFFAKYY